MGNRTFNDAMRHSYIRRKPKDMTTLKELREQGKGLQLINTSGLKKVDLQKLITAKLQKTSIPLKHLHPALVFKQMISTPSWEWRDEQLKHLGQRELQSLCLVMGVAKTGTKSKIVMRLKAIASVRLILRRYTQSNVQQLADDFKGKELRALCKKVGVSIAGGTKYFMAASLISWKISSASIGRRNWDLALADVQSRRDLEKVAA
jgi:hypothetical protein